MKKLFLLLAAVTLVGCTPSLPKDLVGRFQMSEDISPRRCPFTMYLVTDTKTGREFLLSGRGGLVEISPAQ